MSIDCGVEEKGDGVREGDVVEGFGEVDGEVGLVGVEGVVGVLEEVLVEGV